MESTFLCVGTALSKAELPLGTEVYYTAKITPPLPPCLPQPPMSILPAVVNVQCPHLKEVTGEILTQLLVAEWTDKPHALEHSPMVHSLFLHICARSYQLWLVPIQVLELQTVLANKKTYFIQTRARACSHFKHSCSTQLDDIFCGPRPICSTSCICPWNLLNCLWPELHLSFHFNNMILKKKTKNKKTNTFQIR